MLKKGENAQGFPHREEMKNEGFPCCLLSLSLLSVAAVADLGWADWCIAGPHESSLPDGFQSHDAEC